MKRILILFLLLTASNSLRGQTGNKVIWITIDGLRWQELYTGVDSLLLNNPHFVGTNNELKESFWNEDPEVRRNLLFPFFWKTAVEKGIFLGNRLKGNNFEVSNKVLMSYAGYQEILAGFPDDENIKDNSKIENPNETLLEALNKDPRYQDKIGVFASWDVFPYILNEKRSGLKVNAGYRTGLNNNPGPNELLLDKMQEEIPRRWQSVRFDTFTHNYALEYLKNQKPELIFIGYGETDDFAHEGNYEKYLEAAHNTDKLIAELWEYVQADPFYKDQTTFVITTDHGRGEAETEKNTWKHHGPSIENSEQTWFIAFGNRVKKTGEADFVARFYANQVAATVAGLLNSGYKVPARAGAPLPIIKD